jgi:putative transposase
MPRVPDQPAGQAFADWDRELGKAIRGPIWLSDTRLAQLVSDAIVYGAESRKLYDLHAWVVMANHVHVVIVPRVPVPEITRWLKGSTAREANKILGRAGQPFWRDESFDHRVRDLEQVVRYVENNPVAAGLVSRPGDWRWSSAWLAGESACHTL